MINEQVLNQLKKDIEKYKGLKIKAETRMEELQNQKAALEKEVRNMGFDPDTLEQTIADMNNEMELLLEEIENLKPEL
jgi:chromosome segregation ATPase